MLYMVGGRIGKPRIQYFAGLDIGQLADYTALAVMEKVYLYEDRLDIDTRVEYRMVHLERYELGTPYPVVIEKLADFFARVPLAKRTRLAVDVTGVGLAVFQDLQRARLPVRDLLGVLITGGTHATSEGRIYRQPKRELIQPLRVKFEQKEIKLPRGLDHLGVLTEELANYEMRINEKTGHDSYSNNPRETPHDDLVLATSLAYWAMTNRFGQRALRLIR